MANSNADTKLSVRGQTTRQLSSTKNYTTISQQQATHFFAESNMKIKNASKTQERVRHLILQMTAVKRNDQAEQPVH